MKNNNPLSPHIQIYNWHVSSLVSICHRITGILNIAIITLICFLVIFLTFGSSNYELIQNFLKTFFGKFIIIFAVWSFLFQILSEIRHLLMDYGYFFELKAANITGSIVIVGSILLTCLIYIYGRSLI